VNVFYGQILEFANYNEVNEYHRDSSVVVDGHRVGAEVMMPLFVP